MKDAIQQRACDLARYIIQYKATVRAAARQFGISKSTVHKDVKERLKQIDPDLYTHTSLVLSYNKAVRHLRGGEATRRKYRLHSSNSLSHIQKKDLAIGQRM